MQSDSWRSFQAPELRQAFPRAYRRLDRKPMWAWREKLIDGRGRSAVTPCSGEQAVELLMRQTPSRELCEGRRDNLGDIQGHYGQFPEDLPHTVRRPQDATCFLIVTPYWCVSCAGGH